MNKHPLDYWIAALLFLTLIATGTAAIFTRLQWLTADDAEKRSLRSYVNLRDIQLEKRNDGLFDIIPEWENTGNTPTINLRATLNRLETNVEIPNEIAYGDMAGFNTVPMLIGPKSTTGISFGQISKTCLDQFNRRDELRQFRIWGRAIYNDVFTEESKFVEEHHTTNFCWSIDQIIFSLDGESARFSYSLCEQGNCSDSECKPPNHGLFETTVPPCKPVSQIQPQK